MGKVSRGPWAPGAGGRALNPQTDDIEQGPPGKGEAVRQGPGKMRDEIDEASTKAAPARP